MQNTRTSQLKRGVVNEPVVVWSVVPTMHVLYNVCVMYVYAYMNQVLFQMPGTGMLCEIVVEVTLLLTTTQ